MHFHCNLCKHTLTSLEQANDFERYTQWYHSAINIPYHPSSSARMLVLHVRHGAITSGNANGKALLLRSDQRCEHAYSSARSARHHTCRNSKPLRYLMPKILVDCFQTSNIKNCPRLVIYRCVQHSSSRQLLCTLQHLRHLHVRAARNFLHMKPLMCLRRIQQCRVDLSC